MSSALAVDGGLQTPQVGTVQLELSNAIVAIYKQRFGRGPTRARTDWASRDIVICTLEDSLSHAELTLEAMGERQRVLELRAVMQQAMAPDLIATAERILKRRVRAQTGGVDVDNGLANEVFYLEPAPS
jgi:uncharacterized protein YbcI